MPDSDTVHLEYDGARPLALVNSLLDHIEPGGEIERISVEIETESEMEYIPEGFSNIGTVGGERGESQMDSEDTSGETEEETAEDNTDLDVCSFHEDSNTLHIATALYDHRDEGYLDIETVREVTDGDTDVTEGNFSSILWDLANRGLVEKKQHPDDGRKKVYKLTDQGVTCVERFTTD